MPPENAYERAWISLIQARRFLEEEKWEDVATALDAHASDFQTAADLSLQVQRHSLLGQALSGHGNRAPAVKELTVATELWSNPRALEFIRSLPSGERSQISIGAAVDAAAAAAFELAEIRRRQLIKPCPEFKPPKARGVLSSRAAAEAVARDQSESARPLKVALKTYIDNDVLPWAWANRDAITLLSREYEKGYLVPPVAPLNWRIAVAQSIGQLWAERVATIRSVFTPPEPCCDKCYCEGGGDWAEDEKQFARLAFEACVRLSRQYQMYSKYTERCELWLARNYRAEYHQLDEISPYAQYLPTNPLYRSAPETLRP